MKRTIVATRKVVAGMVLMGGALGMYGSLKLAATSHVFPRVPRTEQEQRMASLVKRDGWPAMMSGFRFAARGRSSEGDPCIPTTPVTFSGRVPVIC